MSFFDRFRHPSETLNLLGSSIAIGLIWILGFCTWALVFRAIPERNENALLILIGILSSNVNTIVNFFFGTSATNKQQQQTIDTLAATAQTAQTTLSAVAPVGDPAGITLKPGETAVATASAKGTKIKKDR